MADFGADVIKLEPPYNFPWIVDNRSKRAVALDLRTAEGQGVLHRLVRGPTCS